MPQSANGGESLEAGLRMPEQLTAFSALALLQKVRDSGPLTDAQKEQLDADVLRIEASHFGKADREALELEEILKQWLSRVI